MVLSPDFRVVVAGTCWPPHSLSANSLRRGVIRAVHWDRVVRVARRHRVAGLLLRNLRSLNTDLPSSVISALSEISVEQTRQALAFTFASCRLAAVLRASGIEPIFLKGATLAVLAYGETGLRHAKDIDFFVPVHQEEATATALRSLGYRRRLPGEEVSPQKLALYRRFAHSTEWWNPAGGAEVELHVKLTDMPSLLDSNRALQRLQKVAVTPSCELTTLSTPALFAYLCVHGAGHGWSRLKWLVDVHALLHSAGAVQDGGIPGLYRSAEAMGSGSCAAQALLLCEELFGLVLPGTLRPDLRRRLSVRLAVRIALGTMTRGGAEQEIYDLRFGTATVYLARFLLGRGPGFWWREARARAFPPVALLETRLPAGALALFPALRLGQWIAGAFRRGKGRTA